jgi:hypothetical protein
MPFKLDNFGVDNVDKLGAFSGKVVAYTYFNEDNDDAGTIKTLGYIPNTDTQLQVGDQIKIVNQGGKQHWLFVSVVDPDTGDITLDDCVDEI